MGTRYRKRARYYNDPGNAHFLTFSCAHRWPLLDRDRSRQWAVDAIDKARRDLDYALWAYVIMPEHIHILVFPRQPKYKIGTFRAAIKRTVSVSAKQYLIQENEHDWLHRLTVLRGNREVFQFWLAGGGYDENLWDERPIEEVIRYIHENPVRRGLVHRAVDWKWSSARWHAGFDDVPLAIDPTET